jgi:hypothetical protein
VGYWGTGVSLCEGVGSAEALQRWREWVTWPAMLAANQSSCTNATARVPDDALLYWRGFCNRFRADKWV